MIAFLIAPETVHVASSATVCPSFKHGVWGLSADAGAQVTIKQLDWRDGENQQWLFKVAEASAKFHHPHLLHVYGVCCQGKTPVLLCEHGVRSNLKQFFADGAHRDVFWKIFYEVSLGLQFLESKGVAHDDLQCSNIYIGADGKAKISSDCHWPCNQRRDSKIAPRPSFWRSVLQVFKCDDVSFPSAVFALGICILEAWTGDIAMAGTTQTCPNDMTERAWKLVQKMCHANSLRRPSMTSVSVELLELMNVSMKRHGVACCSRCNSDVSLSDNYCASCGMETKKTAFNALLSHRADRQNVNGEEDSNINCDCSQCAAKVSSSDNFCGACGAKIATYQQHEIKLNESCSGCD